MLITGLRFIERDGKKILQCSGHEILGFDYAEGRMGGGQPIDWHDVSFEPDAEEAGE